MVLAKLLLLLLSAIGTAGSTVENLWPAPREVTGGGGARLSLHRRFHFKISRGYSSAVLDRALVRHACVLHHLRPVAEQPTGRGQGRQTHPPSAPAGIRRLKIHVESPFSSLSLASNESYVLQIQAPTSRLVAATTWGALRGLETFTQLVQRVHAHPHQLESQATEEAAAEAGAEAPAGSGDYSDDEAGGASAPAPGLEPALCEGQLHCLCPLERRHHKRHKHHRRHTLLVVEQVTIEDSPRFTHRGLLLDTARHFLPVGIIKQHLEAMSMAKMNVLHWHITDDQSFPLELESLPRLSQEGAFAPEAVFTKEDMREIVEFAMDRGIRVMPELDVPGHTLSWGQAYPQLLTHCCDSKGHLTGQLGPMDPSSEEVYGLLWRLMRELRRLFPDTYLHIGGDEVPFDCWASNPDIRDFMRQKGMGTDYAALESYFVGRVLQLVAAAGKEAVVWQEVFDNGVALEAGSIVQVWKWWRDQEQQGDDNSDVRQRSLQAMQQHKEQANSHLMTAAGEARADSCAPWLDELKTVTERGYRALLSAPWYLNLGSFGADDWLDYWRVDPRGFKASPDALQRVVGGEAAVWGEHVDATNSVSETWPRAAAVAERLWSPAAGASGDLAQEEASAWRRLTALRCRMLSRGIRASPLAPGFCPHELDDI